MKKKMFLSKFFEDKAKQTIMQCALKKALDINDEEKAKKYSQDLISLENEMGKYIIKNEKLINRIDFSIESSKHRFNEEKQKQLTYEIIGYPMTIDQLEIWMEKKTWNIN